ncbi:MAG: protein kinase domain-containing protein [Streptosporangiaceae bacterium]
MLQGLQPGDPRVIGPYALVGQLGSGGMGRVFLGRSMGGRLVAVKVIRSDLASDPDFRARFRREVAAARRVSGLYTAVVVDADADAEEPWLATAYVAGPSLSEAVHDHGPLPPRSALALAAGLAESLVAIHKVGVVHRDLKPSNVLLAEDGPRLIDFGISRAAESTSVTRAGFVIGSPGFMSPEQAQGTEVGPPSDMFSLGAVLAFAATGEAPFGGGSTAALVFRVVFAPPQLDAVPDELRPLVERCLAKDPAQRPSAGELLTEIGAMQPEAGWLPDPVTGALAGSQAQVVTAPPPPLPAAEAQPVTAPPPPPAAEPEPEAAVEAVEPSAEPVPQAGEPSAEPSDTSPTITGYAPFIAAEPEAVAPEAKTVTPDPATVPPEAERVVPEADTGPTRLGPAAPETGAGPEPATGPGLVREPQPEPVPVAAPLPWADLQRPRRPRVRRPAVVGAVAAAVILIASGATALALSGSGHPSSSAGKKPTIIALATPTAITTSLSQSPTTQPSPIAARTSHHPSAAPSRRPTVQPSTQPAAQPTTHAPAPATSSPAPRPKPTTPKPTHAPPPATYSFSASGASEVSCGDVGSVQSSDGASVQFGFNNNSKGTVVVEGISTSGALVYDATLSPGGQYAIGTNVGAYLVVDKSGGGCLAVFHVNGSGQVTIS